ncbi:hypothetical protein Ahy_A03g014954 [Arachis hypogaea]|uniref:Uncharacterized protein n=1 Tax=Arachis hypogaea TaxID=3818 RepID=A0A445DZ38_ARAHY|nr:hypothetical protein Ahy_A03g014954 [Arachis hypogaea]
MEGESTEIQEDIHPLHSDVLLIADKVHMLPILHVKAICERNWGGHVLNFLIKGTRENTLKKKYAVNGCLFALMIVYFCELTHKNRVIDAIPGPLGSNIRPGNCRLKE